MTKIEEREIKEEKFYYIIITEIEKNYY